MSIYDRDYMRTRPLRRKVPSTRGARITLKGISRSERISLCIGACALTALLFVTLI